MKALSWNVNGLRACLGHGFAAAMAAEDADFICLQETKLQAGQLDPAALAAFSGYHIYWNYAERKGYSGTAVFARREPLAVTAGMGVPEHDTEGRLLTLEYPGYYLVCVYTPNAQRELTRLAYRLTWEQAFADYLTALDEKKPVIVCGDFNVAHQPIDLKNPQQNRGNAGFTDEERAAFSSLLSRGFTDTFRHFYPDAAGIYSWWSYRFRAREKNAGWRIDHFLTSDRIVPALTGASVCPQIAGSDHCPVCLTWNEEKIE